MVFIKINDKLKQLLEHYNKENVKPEIPSTLRLGEFLDYQYVQLLVEQLNKKGYKEKLYLHKLIKPDMMFYSTELDDMEFNQQRDPEFEKYKEQLVARLQEKKYQKMIKNIAPSSESTLLGFQMTKDVNKSVSMGMSYIMTLFASGLSGYYVAKFFGADHNKCLIIGFIFLVATLLMETLLFIIKTGYSKDKIREKLKKI